MPDAADPIVETSQGVHWVNWHDSVGLRVARYVNILNARPNATPTIDRYNQTTAALQDLLREALRTNSSVRGLGAGWSFSPIAVTGDVLINTRNLNFLFYPPTTPYLSPAFAGRAEDLVFAQCGVSIAELNYELGQVGKSLKTSGASNGQTIAGAISTGTHGAAIEVGAVHDSIVALHIITAPDRHVWIERDSYPVMAETFSQDRLGAELIRNDAIFDAAVVSLGSLGLIHGVIIEVEDRFHLQVFRQRMALDDGLWAAMDRLDFSDATVPGPPGKRPYHFQAVFNPQDQDRRPYVTVMYKYAEGERPADCTPINRSQRWHPGDDAAAVMGRIIDATSGIVPLISRALVDSQYGDINSECGTLGEVFSAMALRGRLASAAVGLPLGRVREAIDALIALDLDERDNRQEPFPGLFSLRYVKGTSATLGFTRHQLHTCVLELDAPQSTKTERFYAMAWDRFMAMDLRFTFHWGKLQRADPTLTDWMYGAEAVRSWRTARHTLLPTPELRRLFTNAMLETLGLAD